MGALGALARPGFLRWLASCWVDGRTLVGQRPVDSVCAECNHHSYGIGALALGQWGLLERRGSSTVVRFGTTEGQLTRPSGPVLRQNGWGRVRRAGGARVVRIIPVKI